jgi:hypothetical protein
MKRKEKETLSTRIDNHKLTILEQDFGNNIQYRLHMEYDSGDCMDTSFQTSIDLLTKNDLLDLAKFFLEASGRKNLKIKSKFGQTPKTNKGK